MNESVTAIFLHLLTTEVMRLVVNIGIQKTITTLVYYEVDRFSQLDQVYWK